MYEVTGIGAEDTIGARSVAILTNHDPHSVHRSQVHLRQLAAAPRRNGNSRCLGQPYLAGPFERGDRVVTARLDVLIVSAGPIGLALACHLRRLRPPNILRSVMSFWAPNAWRIRFASCSLYAIDRN